MRGSRKFMVIVLYIFAITAIALTVINKRYDSLLGVGSLATGLATGVGAFVYGNVKEHQAKKQDEPKV